MRVIKGRRSIRRYQEREVPEEYLEQVLEAVQWSPSWANTQCWDVMIVRDIEKKLELKGILGKNNPSQKAFEEAPLVLALCAERERSGFYKGQAITKFGDWFMFDLGIATQSLCLSAHKLGLGTVIVGVFDHDRAKEILNVAEKYEVVVLIPLGYPAKDSPAPRRREIKDFSHRDTF
jgi:nitroreductase